MARENQEPAISGEFPASKITRKINNPYDFASYNEVETDQESIGSLEETESPRSVTKIADHKNLAYVNYQIRRIREEDLHLGEDIGGGFNAKEKMNSINWCDVVVDNNNNHHRAHSYQNRVFIFSRRILPSSPLGGKNSTLGADIN